MSVILPVKHINKKRLPVGGRFLCGAYHQWQMCRVAPCVPVRFRVFRFMRK
nr:MAG TPA: hypothetical protein [Caudoviricetes sp.]